MILLKSIQDMKKRTEIVADVEALSGSPILHIGFKIPGGSTTNGVVTTTNATEENRSQDDHEHSFHCPDWPHFPTNQTKKSKTQS